VLWGKGGRGIVLTCVAVVALAAPFAAFASPGKGNGNSPAPVTTTTTTSTTPAPPAAPPTNTPDGKTWVAPGLLKQAGSNPNGLVDVIIESSGGVDGAGKALKWLGRSLNGVTNLNLVGGVEVQLPAGQVAKLQNVPGLMVVPNATVKVSGLISTPTSTQLWPYESGNALLWPGDSSIYAGQDPAIAIVDSGIQSRSDFGNRIVANVDLSTIPGNTATDPNASADLNGHGTFVAGIAAGNAPGLAGAAPGAPIVAIKVMDSNGSAKTSDIITACQWILDHKSQYNIRVANFSLHSSYATNFYRDPLDQAVEKLWFNGVVVVAAAGNYGISNTQPSGVVYSPGNDPFVITVGAVDMGDSLRKNDDAAAPFSAWGYTNDGFFKPEVAAPGRYMVGPVPAGSALTQVKAQNMVGTDRIQLSGTSFAAPIVSGTVADILARHPDWTPDQVKGDLMRTARAVKTGAPQSAGLGEVMASRAVSNTVTPNPNLGLDQFVSSGAFNGSAWAAAAKASGKAWNAMSWADQSWSDMSWADQAWATMSWADQSWSDMSWTDMSWADMSWADVSQEDAAEGDSISGSAGYTAPADVAAQAAADPDTAVPVDGLSPAVALGVSTSSATSSTTPTATPTTTTTTPTATTPTVTTTTPTVTTTTPTVTTTAPTTTTTTATTVTSTSVAGP
jgi:serine protease AprX